MIFQSKIPLFLLVVACSGGDGAGADSAAGRSPGESAREVAVAIDRRVPTLQRKTWTSAMGDASATLNAFLDDGKVRLIRERLDQGDYGNASNRYYFADGKLRYYESQGETLATDSAGAPSVRRKERVVMAFDILGSLVDGSRQLDGERAALDDARVQGVLARADELRRQEASAPLAPAKQP